jgi:hypothetical protein
MPLQGNPYTKAGKYFVNLKKPGLSFQNFTLYNYYVSSFIQLLLKSITFVDLHHVLLSLEIGVKYSRQ